MKRAFFVENIPNPGEPFLEKIHPENRAALQQDVEERLMILRDRLSNRALKQTQRLMREIQNKLRRAKYKNLCIEREKCFNEVQKLSAEWKKSKKEKTKKRGLKLNQRGRELTTKIKKFEPLIAEFFACKEKIEAHQRVIEWMRREDQKRAMLQDEATTFKSLIDATFSQLPELHHMKRDAKGNEKKKLPIIKKADVLPDSILFRLQTAKQNIIQWLFGRWTSAIPYGVKVKDLISDETLLAMTTMVGKNVTVLRNSRTQNIFYRVSRLDGNSGLPDEVLYERTIEFYPVEKHTMTPWTAGVDGNGTLVQFDFQSFPHVLVAGTTGGGKSNFMNQMLACILGMNSPQEIRTVFIDNKGGVELKNWEGVPHQLMPMCRKIEQVAPTLLEVERLMTERYDLFYKCKVSSLEEYNEQFEPKLPRLILTVDEMATLAGLGKETTEIHSLLRNITSLGRAAGVHCILFTQHPTIDIIPGWVKANLVLRIATKVPNHNNSQVIVDSNTAAELEDKPGRMVARVGPREIIFQAPLITPQSIAKARALAMSYETTQPDAESPETATSNALPTITPRLKRPKFGRDEFLDICLEELEGKISAIRVHQLVGDDVMSLYYIREMVKKILEDAENNDWTLTHNETEYLLKKLPGRGSYKMILPSEDTSEDEPPDSTDADLSSDTTEPSDSDYQEAA